MKRFCISYGIICTSYMFFKPIENLRSHIHLAIFCMESFWSHFEFSCLLMHETPKHGKEGNCYEQKAMHRYNGRGRHACMGLYGCSKDSVATVRKVSVLPSSWTTTSKLEFSNIVVVKAIYIFVMRMDRSSFM